MQTADSFGALPAIATDQKVAVIVSVNPAWRDLSLEWYARHEFQPAAGYAAHKYERRSWWLRLSAPLKFLPKMPQNTKARPEGCTLPRKLPLYIYYLKFEGVNRR